MPGPKAVSQTIPVIQKRQILTVTQRYQYAHPRAKASESSINLSAYSVNDPVTGITVAISPSDCLAKLSASLKRHGIEVRT